MSEHESNSNPFASPESTDGLEMNGEESVIALRQKYLAVEGRFRIIGISVVQIAVVLFVLVSYELQQDFEQAKSIPDEGVYEFTSVIFGCSTLYLLGLVAIGVGLYFQHRIAQILLSLFSIIPAVLIVSTSSVFFKFITAVFMIVLLSALYSPGANRILSKEYKRIKQQTPDLKPVYSDPLAYIWVSLIIALIAIMLN